MYSWNSNPLQLSILHNVLNTLFNAKFTRTLNTRCSVYMHINQRLEPTAAFSGERASRMLTYANIIWSTLSEKIECDEATCIFTQSLIQSCRIQLGDEMHYLHVESFIIRFIDIYLKELYKLIKTIRIIIDSSVGEKRKIKRFINLYWSLHILIYILIINKMRKLFIYF